MNEIFFLSDTNNCCIPRTVSDGSKYFVLTIAICLHLRFQLFRFPRKLPLPPRLLFRPRFFFKPLYFSEQFFSFRVGGYLLVKRVAIGNRHAADLDGTTNN
jgi:hypothetical protein